MEKTKSFQKWLLPAAHPLAVYAVVTVLTLLYHGKVIGNVASLVLLLAVLAVGAPVFFWMKPRDVAPWKSDLITACAHLVFSGALWGMAALLDLGWTNAMLYWALLFVFVFYACLIGLDLLIALFRKMRKTVGV